MKFHKNETVLFQGDSITDGGRHIGTTDQNHMIGHSFPYLISAELALKCVDLKPTFLSRGVSGNDIHMMHERWQEDTLNLNPTILNILIGANDSLYQAEGKGNTYKQYETEFSEIIEETKSVIPDIKIIICEPAFFDVNKDEISRKMIEYCAERRIIAKKTAEKYGCIFVPLQQEFDAYAKRVGDCSKILWDGIHPTILGHAIIAKKWFEAVQIY